MLLQLSLNEICLPNNSYSALPFAISFVVIPIVAATCDIDASKVIPVCVAEVAIFLMPLAIALMPSFMTLDKSSAFKTSANIEVLSAESSTSFPYCSIVVQAGIVHSALLHH